MSALPTVSSNTAAGLSTAMFFGVVIMAIAGFVVAIMNLREPNLDCGVRSTSIAYITFFLLATVSVILGSGAVLGGERAAGTLGSLVGGTAGATLVTVMSSILFVLGVMLFTQSGKIPNERLRKMNYAVFGIYSLLSVINLIFTFYQRRNILESQPAIKVLDTLRGRFGSPTQAVPSNYAPVTTSASGYRLSPVRV